MTRKSLPLPECILENTKLLPVAALVSTEILLSSKIFQAINILLTHAEHLQNSSILDFLNHIRETLLFKAPHGVSNAIPVTTKKLFPEPEDHASSESFKSMIKAHSPVQLLEIIPSKGIAKIAVSEFSLLAVSVTLVCTFPASQNPASLP